MPATAPKPDPKTVPVQRAIVLRAADADVVKLLRQAQADVIRQLNEILSRPAGIGRDVRIAQLNLVRRNLSREMGKVWRELGNITEARRAEAAGRVVNYNEQLDRFKLVSAGVPGGADIARAIAESEADTVASGIDRLIARSTGASYVPLVQRVYNSNVGIGQQVDRLVNSAITRGLSAREFAAEVRGFINPATPGGVRYAAMRLARTEINNAAHAVAVQSVQDKPWVETMEWRLSGSHGRPDVCDRYAKGGPNNDGKYPKGSVPAKPHPQCLCYVIPSEMDDDEFVNNLLAGKYENYISKYRNIQPGQVIRSDFGGYRGPPPRAASAVKPTKVGQAPQKRAQPPTKAAPPQPGATTAKDLTPAEAYTRKALAEGKSTREILKGLKDGHGMSQADGLKTVLQAKRDQPGALVGPLKGAPGRSATPAARVSPPATPARPPLNSNPLPDVRASLEAANKLPPSAARRMIQDELNFQGELAPVMARRLRSLEPMPPEKAALRTTNADYNFGTATIRVNPMIFERGQGDLLKAARGKFKSLCGDAHNGQQSTVAHEFGHHIETGLPRHGTKSRAKFNDLLARELGVPPIRNYVNEAEWFKANKAVIKTKVSIYGSTNMHELLAEIWREYSTNPSARAYIGRIGKVMRDLAEGVHRWT